MRNAITVLLAVAIVGLIGALYRQSTVLSAVQQQLGTLSSQLEVASKGAALDLQEKCAKQAHSEFVDFLKSPFVDRNMASFTNHYNSKLNKCFIRIDWTTASTSATYIYASVTDAFEGQVYGSYTWHTVKDKKYWEVPPSTCEVIPPSGSKETCHSSDEFDSLLKPYLD